MKTIKLLFVALIITCFSFGQSNKEDIDMIQATFGKEKKEIVQNYMALSDTQKAPFWSLYDQYETDRKAYGKKRVALLEDYANSYATLTNENASSLMDKKLALYNDYGSLQKKYFGKFSKIIGGVQAAKFFQLEDYIENNLRLTVQEEIPFIGELDKTKVK